MNLRFQRLAARGRVALVPLVTAGAVVALGPGVASASRKHANAHAQISKKELKTLKRYVAMEQRAPKWVAPGPAVNARKALRGKRIVTFPISSEIDACNLEGEQGYLDTEAKALGAKVIALNTTSGPPSWISNINTAITEKANAVVGLCSMTGAAISSQLETLKKDHIAFVDGNYNQTAGYKAFPLTNISAESGVDAEGGMRADLADALVNLKGQPAHILFLDSPTSAPYLGERDALNAAIKKWCPNTCTIEKEEDFGTQDWSGPKETSEVTSDLQANHKINAVIVAFDGMADGIESAVTAASATHPGLRMYAWGGGLAEIKAVQNGGTFVADSGPDEKWDAYNTLDQVIRLLARKHPAPVTREIAPNIFFTKKNAALFSAGGQGKAYSDRAYGHGSFVKDYLKLWEAGK